MTASTAETAVMAMEKREVVALLGLRIDEDLGLARRVRRGGPGDAGEEHRQHHVDLRERSRPVPDHGARQRHQPVGDAADAHQVGGQQEERHRQQDERIVGVEGLLREHHDRQPRLDQQDRQAGEAQREGDGHAHDEQAKEDAEQDDRGLPGGKNVAAHHALPDQNPDLVDDLLAEEHDPGDAGHRPGDVDQPQRQIGKLRGAIPGKARELDPGDTKTSASASTPSRARIRTMASVRRDRSGQTSTSKCCDSRRRPWRRS